MASFSQKTGIIGALVIAGVLIATSIFISYNGLAIFNPSPANAASTQALLQAYATRDSDHDGLPDWQEALYGLDPNNPHSFSPNMTDGQAVAEGLVKPKFLTEAASSTDDTVATSSLEGPTAAPGSLTEQFSQSLLSQYLTQTANSGADLSDNDVAPFAQTAMQNFALEHAHQDVYALGQVQVGGSGATAMTTYAGAAEAVLAANSSHQSESEVDYFADAIEKNDSADLANVAAIGKDYTDMAPAFMKLQVPTEAEYAHLEIANALARLGDDITDLSMMDSDPLRAYLGLAQYQIDTTSLAKGFSDMGIVFSDEQLSIPSGTPGYYFYRIATQTSPTKGDVPSNN